MQRDIYSETNPVASISAQAVTAAVNGLMVDLQDFQSADVIIDLGTFAGTSPSASIAIQDSPDGSTWSAVPAANLQGGALPVTFAAADAGKTYERGYQGSQRYVRVAVTTISGSGASLPISAVVLRSHASQPKAKATY